LNRFGKANEASLDIWFPVVKVMTKAMLFEYVEGSASRGTIREEKELEKSGLDIINLY
jgi:hypothetical protein